MYTVANGMDSMAIGNAAKAGGQASIAFGMQSSATGYNAQAMGTGAQALQQDALAIGHNSMTTTTRSVAMGTAANATGATSTALGAASIASASNSVALGQKSIADRANTVSIGAAGSERQIANMAKGTADTDAVNVAQLKSAGLNVDAAGNVTNSFVSYDDAARGKVTLAGGTAGTTVANVRAGAVSVSSTDAINGSQLYTLASSDAKALGGGSTVNADGSVSTPVYSVGGKTVDGVDGAVNALDGRINNVVTDTARQLKYVKFGDTTAMDATASGTDSVAVGPYAQATGTGSVAFGANARATASNAVAVGFGSSASEADTFAVGSNTSKRRIVNVADAKNVSDAVTLGQMNSAIGAAIVNSSAKNNGMLGSSTQLLGATQSSKTPDQLIVSGPTTLSTPTDAIGANGIAIGLNTHANAANAVAAGQNVSVLGSNGVGVGQNIAVGADSAVAIGVGTSVASENSVAIGSNGTEVNTGAANAVSIGSGVSVGGNGTVGIGSNIIAATTNSVVLGANSSDDNRANTVSVGSSAVPGMGTSVVHRQVINVAAGTLDYDAVNVSQLKGVTATLGGGAAVSSDGTIKKPSYQVAGGTYSDVGAALGAVDTMAKTGLADAVKYDTSKHDKVTLGGGTAGTTLTNVAAGKADLDAVNMAQLKAAGLNVDTSGNVTNSFVAYDDSTQGKVTLAGGTAGTTVTNVKAGAVSASSTDAINGSQLYNVASTTAAALGGGATVNADGTVKKPSYDVGGGTYSDVGSALAAVDAKAAAGSVDGVKYDTSAHDKVTFGGTSGTRLSNVMAGTTDTDAVNLAQLKAAGLNVDTSGNVTNSFVAYDDSTQGKVTLAGGTAGTTITNVKAGALSATSTDAVNGSQLYATNQNVAKNTGDITTLNTQVTTINGELADAVKYDTSTHDKVTLAGGTAGTTLGNVAAGKADLDAVNMAQLKAAGLNVDTSGNVTNSFVAYDDSTQGKVTLAGGTAGTTIANVKAGALSATSTDAVNGSQLYATNQNVAKNTGDITTLNTQVTTINGELADAVKYDTSAHDKVTLAGGTAGTTLGNVAAGKADLDAVNMAQLKAAGLSVDTSGNVTNSFVAYDDSTQGKVTLAGGTAGTTVTNVKAGAVGASSTDAINGSQLYNVASTTAAALGGGATVNADGTVKKPSYDVGGGTYSDVGSALAAVDAKAAAGSVDGVKYDTSAHDKVTFGGTSGTRLSNVMAGTTDTDAVNLAQLKAAGLNVDTSGNVTNSFVAYDDSTQGKVTLAGGTAGTTITNVKAGTIGAASTDAINGSQLYGEASSVASALGGGATVNTDGTIKAPSYTVQGQTKTDVGSALAVIDTATTGNTTSITNLTNNINNGKIGLVQQDATTKTITVAKATDGTTVDFTGTAGARQLNGVAAGKADTDAVNLAQLKAAGLNVDTSGNVTNSFVAYDDAARGKVTLAGGTAGTTVTNVKAGAVGASSTDAINGSQLYTLASSDAKAFGGGSTVNADGSVSMPEYSVGGKTVDGVGGAVTALDTRITDMTSSMVEIAPKLKYIKFGDTTALDATAAGIDAVAIGGFAQATGDGALAIGANARAMGTNSVAIGYGSSTSQANTFAVGSTTGKRRIVNVADGVSITDAVTVGQMNTAIGAAISNAGVKNNGMLGASTKLLGATSSKTPDQLIVAGPTTLSTPTDALGNNGIAMGLNAHANADNAVAAGQNVSVLGSNGVAVGQNIAVGADSAVAIGSTVSAASINAVAIGSNGTEVNTGADNAVAIGSGVSVGGKNTVGIGSNIIAATEGSVVLGANSSDDNRANTVSVGASAVPGMGTSVVHRQVINVADGTQDYDAINLRQLKAAGLHVDTSGNATNSFVAYDDSTKGTVTLAGGTAGTSITNLKAGSIGASSTDAINGSQLYNTANSTAAALGGGASVDASGKVVKPSYNVAGSTYGDVGSALAAVDAKAATGSVDGVKYDTSAHDTVTFSGTSGTRLSNVMAGTTDTDAVNLAQLKAAGLNVDTSGNVTNSFVAYDDSTQGKVTLAGGTAGTTIANVRAGALSSTSTDAVNGSQLYATNQNVAKNTGDITTLNTQVTTINGELADAVKYDASTHDKVTLAGGTAGTTITNVKAGGISSTSTDAINGAQLYNTANSTAQALGGGSTVNADGTVKKPSYNVAGSTYGDVGSALAAVDAKAATGSVDGIKYDTSAHDSVTFSGASGTILSNVNAGVADKDAVNVAQLKAAGLNIDTSGAVTNAFVSYDDAAKSTVTLGGASGTTIANVKAGAVSATSKDAVNGAQLYNVANSTASALGGGSTVNTDGTVSAPTYSLNEGSTKVHTVGDAISNLDGRVTQNTSDITNIANTLVDGGVIDGKTGKSLAVVYDSASKDSVTFGGNGATPPVALHNVAAGKLSADSTDAVNGSQLYDTNKRISEIDYNFDHIGDAVMYDTSKHDSITLGGIAGGKTAPVVLTNVADGKGKYDAVNFGQLSALQGQVTNLDNRVTVVEGQVTNISGGGSNWNNDAGGKKITNVAAGTAATDAVNVGQLNDAVDSAHDYTDARVGDLPTGVSAKDYTDQRINSMQSQVNSVAKNAYGGIAAATALTMIPDVDQGKTIAVGVGTGNYKGYQAVALGASARITQNLKVKLGAGMAPGNGTTVGAGASYQW
ncbi:YadA-like family protein [Paraburkholderia rhizosphaerae]